MIGTLRRKIGAKLARARTSGSDLPAALRACRQASLRGWGCALGFWDGPDETAVTIATRYHNALDAIVGERLDGHLSVKPTAFRHDFELLKELLDRVAGEGRRVHLNSHDIVSAEADFRLLERIAASGRSVGCTLPARWERSLRDVERVLAWGIPVRLVKGQWPDAPGRDGDPRARFLALVDALVGRAVHVSISTHDVALARFALARLHASATPCELEQLIGLPVRAGVARALGVNIRIYVPFGRASEAYASSRAGNGAPQPTRLLRDALLGLKVV